MVDPLKDQPDGRSVEAVGTEQDQPQGDPAQVTCRFCDTDISRSCSAFVLRGPLRDQLVVIRPLLCPECAMPLFYLRQQQVHVPRRS